MENTQDFQFDGATLTKYTGPGGDVVIPDGVTAIGNAAFLRCRLLTSVTIPAGVMDIRYRSFYLCTGLTDLTIPDSVVSIGESAFDTCLGLHSLIIPPSVTSVGTWAFSSCENLTTAIIAGDQVNLGNRVFKYCTKLAQISMSRFAFESGNWQFTGGNAGLAVRDGEKWSFYAYVSKADNDNFTELVSQGKWNTYDVDLINNGPLFRYKAPAKLLGSLGRLVDPVELNDECRQLHLEYLIKNAKKLIPIAEELRCPAIVEAMKTHGVINDKNKKAIAKLLAASGVPEIAAIEL